MQLFLRIYAVAYLVLVIAGLGPTLSQASHLQVIQIIDLAFFTPVAVVGLWSAAYRHLNLPMNGWKILLFASVFWRPLSVGNAVLSGDVIPRFQSIVAAVTRATGADSASIMLLGVAAACFLGSLLILPPLVALYRNAYGDESLLKLMSPYTRSNRTAA